MIDLDFPWIYVWDCNDIKGLNVTIDKYITIVKRIIGYRKLYSVHR